ncbi:Spy/CpxP family protein refolding chaperone [Pseudoalteromonas mariniglutinosa]|uniref:Spy/CpxP family protein refolding chaperone n=1 Tax=Pseudoalteromonas mariniglutinosa TaxID=206042 RepID=UPI00384B909B
MTITNKCSKWLLVCGLATAALGTSVAMAKDGMHHSAPEVRFLLSERVVNKLKLTAAQQLKLKAALDAHKAQMQTQRADKPTRQAERAAFRAKKEVLLANSSFDESAATELVTLGVEKMQQFAMQKLKMEHTIWQTLNAEQREKYREMQSHFTKKGHKKGYRKGKHSAHEAQAKS